jgi:hypothetical protein
VFKKADDILIDYIRTGLGEAYQIIIPKHDPVTGALIYAIERQGIELTEPIIKTMFSTYEQKKKTAIKEGGLQ